jgi:hypothetical protein
MTHTVIALSRTGERSEAALEKLKDTRERVRDDLAPDKAEGLERIAQETEPLPGATAGRRFDVGDAQAAKPVGDLHEALGGAKAAGEPVEKHRAPAKAGEDEEGEEESPMSRLRKAKDRAKRDMEKNE